MKNYFPPLETPIRELFQVKCIFPNKAIVKKKNGIAIHPHYTFAGPKQRLYFLLPKKCCGRVRGVGGGRGYRPPEVEKIRVCLLMFLKQFLKANKHKAISTVLRTKDYTILHHISCHMSISMVNRLLLSKITDIGNLNVH